MIHEKTMIPAVSNLLLPVGYLCKFFFAAAIPVKTKTPEDAKSMKASAIVANKASDPDVMAA
jgi:hypothetical protein